MARRFPVWIAVVLAGMVGVAAWGMMGRGGGRDPASGAPSSSGLPASDSGTAVALGIDSKNADDAPASREAVAPPESMPSWTLRARVVDSRGVPVAGAAVRGTLDDASDAQFLTLTDDSGRLLVKREGRVECCLRIEVDAEGFAREWWNLDDAQLARRSRSDGEVDLGDLTLTRSGTIAGRLVDAEGNGLARAFGVVCRDEAHGRPLGARSESNSFGRIETATNPLTGEFRLERVPEGLRTLFLRWPNVEGAREERRDSVVVKAGETRHTTIATVLSSRCDMLFVKFELPQGLARVSHDHVVLMGSDGLARSAYVHDNYHWVFVGLPDEDYTLSVDDPLLMPARRSRLRPSDGPVSVKLEGGSAVKLEIVDAESGRPIDGASSTVKCADASGERYSYTIESEHSKTAEVDVDGVPSGDVTWSVEAEGYRPSHGVLGGLTRGETRSVAIRLEREVEAPKTHARVKGRVVSPEGFPHRRPVLVVLARAAPSSRLELRLELPTDAGWNDIDNVLTQSSTYEFVAREPGVYRIQALSGGGSVATSGLFHVADSTPIDVPILTVPEERIVRGALTVPLGYEADGGRLLWLRHETKPETQSAESRWFERYVVGLTVDTSSGGAFEVKGLSDGEYDIHLTRVRSAGAPLPTELTFGAVILGTVAIHGGDVEGVRLAVPSEALTRVRIEVRAGGAPLSFAALQVTSLDGERVQWLTCDAEGIATVGPIPSGAMNVFVYNLEGGWRYRGELSHTCAGPRSTVTIDLPLTTTLLTLVDDKEAKLANKVVNVLAEFGPGSPHYFDSILRIGPAGQLELRVPAAPGRIRVFHTSGQAQIDFDTIPPAEATLVVK